MTTIDKLNTELFQSVSPTWGEYDANEINEYFAVPLSVAGFASIEDLKTFHDWLDFYVACKMQGGEGMLAERVFEKWAISVYCPAL